MIPKFNILRNEAGNDGGGDGGGSNAGQASGGAATASGTAAGSSLLAGASSAGSAASGAATGTGANGSQAANQASGAAASGSQQFDFRALIGDDGNFLHDKLPEDLKGLSKFRNPQQLVEGYTNLSTLLGKKADAVVIPGPDASKEEWAPVLKRLGVPDSPEGYGLKVPEKPPEGVTVDPAEVQEFAKFAHELGLTPQQAAKLQEYDIGRAGKSVAATAAAQAAAEEAKFREQGEILTKAWGNGNDRIQKAALAERAALTFGFTPEEVKSHPLFSDARFVMTLAQAGAAMSEDTLVKGENINSSGGLKAKAMDVINNPQNPLYKKYWDGDESTANQVRQWMKAAG